MEEGNEDVEDENIKIEEEQEPAEILFQEQDLNLCQN